MAKARVHNPACFKAVLLKTDQATSSSIIVD